MSRWEHALTRNLERSAAAYGLSDVPDDPAEPLDMLVTPIDVIRALASGIVEPDDLADWVDSLMGQTANVLRVIQTAQNPQMVRASLVVLLAQASTCAVDYGRRLEREGRSA